MDATHASGGSARPHDGGPDRGEGRQATPRRLPPFGWLDLLGLLAAVVFALPALTYPHGNDQSLHWYVGKGWLDGYWPYADAISGKPIMIFLVHAASVLLFGNGQHAIRAFEILTLIACVPLVAMAARPRGQPRRPGELGLAAIALFGLYYTYFDYWDISHPELWVATLCLGALCVAARDARPLRRVFVVGLLSAVAFMFKYTAAVLAFPIAAYLGLRAMRERPTRSHPLLEVAIAAGIYLSAVAMVFGLCVLPFVLKGAFDAMWEVLVTFLLQYAKDAPGIVIPVFWIRPSYGGTVLVAGPAALALGAFLLHRRGELRRQFETPLLLLVLLAAAYLSVMLQNRFYTYHFTVATPFVAACLVWGMAQLFPLRVGRRLALAAVLLLAGLLAGPRWASNSRYSYRDHIVNSAQYLWGDRSRNDFLIPFIGMNYLDHYRNHEYIGRAILEHARPGDTLCARGFAPTLYQITGLRCPARQVVESWPSGLPQWEEEYQRMLRETPPTFVVTFSDRPHELRALRRMGYRKRDMPTIYVLMERRPGELPARRPRLRRLRPRRPAPARR
ncbi:MAG: glycosyltransferase family 39 protein [Myxococcales bacterium]